MYQWKLKTFKRTRENVLKVSAQPQLKIVSHMYDPVTICDYTMAGIMHSRVVWEKAFQASISTSFQLLLRVERHSNQDWPAHGVTSMACMQGDFWHRGL